MFHNFNGRLENKREKIEIVIKNWEIFYKGEGFKIKNGRTVKGKEIGNFIEEIDNLKEPFMKSLSKNIFTKKVVPLHEKMTEIAEIIYSIAENEKRKSKRFTHNDVSVYTYKFIFDRELNFVQENGVTKDFLELIGGEIDTIMIDEFQDTSVLQWKILSLLMESAKNIICVGDEKQSIYGWRGGEKELFEKLDKIIDGKVENLDKSYRSYKQVIENVNRIYENYGENWEYSPVKYRDDEEYQGGYFSYCLREIPDKSEVAKTYEDIVDMIKKGKIKNLGKSCILCRTNTQIQKIVERLNEENIPYTLNNNASILNHEAVNPLYKLIKYFVFHNFVYFLEFMRSALIGCLNDHVGYLLENKLKIEEYMRDGKNETFSEYVDRQEEITAVSLKKYEEIDKMNILNADFLAMRRALNELKSIRNEKEYTVLVDGNLKIKEYVGKQFPIVKGDAKSLSIAAASIIAKVTRDRLMKDLASTYPDYCFEKHKGYGTKAHIEVIKDKGAIEGVHRKVFLRKILDEPKEEQLTILG